VVATRQSSLHAYGTGDEALVEALEAGGCPLCTMTRRGGLRFLESVMFELVNDVTFRQRLTAGGGLCPDHVRDLAPVERREAGGVLGSAILLLAMLKPRLAALVEPGIERKLNRGRVERAARAAWECPACEREAASARDAAYRLLQLAMRDPVWARRVSAASFCLAHLALLSGVTDRALRERGLEEPQRVVVQEQQRRLTDVATRLEAFVHHSAHDRRAEITDEERAAVREAAVALARSDRGEGR
jgi:hypothetical protein